MKRNKTSYMKELSAKCLTTFSILAVMIMVVTPWQRANAQQPQRSPIAAFKDGFTLEQSKKSLSERDLPKWMAGGDSSVWVNLHMSEALPTVVVPNRQPARDLPKAINPAIREIKAETKHIGTLTLDEFMSHSKSYAQAFIVVHQGKIVYENYAAMQSVDHHL